MKYSLNLTVFDVLFTNW